MTISQLQSFLTVSRCLSFTEGARQLCLSQPAVSRQIAALEGEIGAPLFERGRGALSLTAAGRHLSEHLPALLEQLQALFSQTDLIAKGAAGWLRLGLLEDQSLDGQLSRALRELQSSAVHLSVQRMTFRELEAALSAGDIDAAVSIEQSADAFPGFSRFLYREEAICLAIHRDLLDRYAGCTPEEILDHCPILIPKLDTFQRNQYSSLASMTDTPLKGVTEYEFSSIAPMVAAGLAATTANESHCLATDSLVSLLPLRALPGVRKGIFWQDANPNPVIPLLLRCLADTAV